MKQHILKALTVLTLIFIVSSCTTTQTAKVYTYSATVWQAISVNQILITSNGTTDQSGGLLGHYLGEAVRIGVDSTMPNDSVTIGAFSISSPTLNKCLPIKKWSEGAGTVYAICDNQASDRCAIVSIKTSSSTLTEPLLKELIKKFVPNKPDTGDGK